MGLSEAFKQGSDLSHLCGVAGCGPALLASRIHLEQSTKEDPCLIVLIVPQAKEAQDTVDELAAFVPTARIAFLPTVDTNPFEGIRSDRSVTLNRAGILGALEARKLDFLVTTASGWIRKVAPSSALRNGGVWLRLGEQLDPTKLSEKLEGGGYERSVVVEDPGTFAVRGDIMDLWPPLQPEPLRLFLEFDTLRTISPFNPESQIASGTWTPDDDERGLFLSPAREAVITAEGAERAETVMRSLVDQVSLPSSKARMLIDDVKTGRMFLGGAAFLPAHFELSGLHSYLPDKTVILVDDPARIVDCAVDEIARANDAYENRKQEPNFSPEQHYLMGAELDASLQRQNVLCLHRSSLRGPVEKGFSGLRNAPLDCPGVDQVSQEALALALRESRKSSGRGAGLELLATRLTSWLDDGMSVFLSARTQTQADRLSSLLEHRGHRAEPGPLQIEPGSGKGLQISVAPLSRGLVAVSESLVFLSEEEIFGARQHQRKRAAKFKDALDDLRQLREGDFVVHVDHGIGRYRGLSHHRTADSAVDLLIVEYHGGDKLLLPVYRLNQIQKFSGEGQPKLDRLGGQTFGREKSKVRKRVRIMADTLLRLYAERKELSRPPIKVPEDEFAAFEAGFPYEETPDQAAAILDVVSDLQGPTVMDRLVCGDVGFGKTEVALRAAFLAVFAGRQVALLCPTTILAEQHLRTFTERLEDSGAVVRGLSRFQSNRAQLETCAGLKNGSVDIVVGTHRALSKDVHFKNLGLLIIDEEQRFGVTHKERLKELRKHVDVLTLSATPIPRTLSLSVAGLRDMSIIQTPPQNRRSIRTLSSRFDERVISEAVKRELARGGQVYYVHNRIEGIYERAALLQRLVPEARVAVGHGQMSEKDLEKTMLDFVGGKFDVLCATSIIESGLDIPRANTMIIDRADLFGLSQLYQIRGRVGRSSERAYCYLLVPSDARLSDEARRRIEALERYSELGSGFQVATMDMEIRGTGELLGADQSGFVSRVGFELFSEMLEEASCELRGASYIKDVDPELSIDVAALLPEEYIEDIGSRLSLYKRYASAKDEDDIRSLNQELESRFGAPPPEARRFASVMLLKTELRRLRALGLSATRSSATLHLRADTPLSPLRLVPFIGASQGKYRLAPDGRITRRSKFEERRDGLEHAEIMIEELARLLETSV